MKFKLCWRFVRLDLLVIGMVDKVYEGWEGVIIIGEGFIVGVRFWKIRIIWIGEEGIIDVGSSMNKGLEVGMSIVCGKVSEGTVIVGVEYGFWRGIGDKVEEG